MILLQIPGVGEIASGLTGDYAKQTLQQNSPLLVMLIFMTVMMLSLTEPLKLVFRRNIGIKSLSLLGVLAGCAVCMTWVLITGLATMALLFLIIHFFTQSNRLAWALIPVFLFCAAQVDFLYKATMKIFHLGMMEHYRAKAENALTYEKIHYRGDSFLLSDYFKSGWTKEKLWRIGEPKYIFKVSAILLFIAPFIGIPLFFSSISFWVNEWYQVYFKPERMKRHYLDMKIEMQEANMYYNQSTTGGTTARVSVDK